MAALALELVPIAGLVFSFTSIIGAALWASDIEKMNRSTTSPIDTQIDRGDSEEEVPVEIETM